MSKIKINRIKEDDFQTIGELQVDNGFTCKTLELPWRDNQRRISRIPEGNYIAIPHISPRFGNSIWIQNVPNRSEILIHLGNYHRDTLGCILVGKDFYDIDNDGHVDVTMSRVTMEDLYDVIKDNAQIEIEIKDNFK